MKRLLIALALLWSSPALAQNVLCPTRPAGDSSNACASTAFVQGAVSAPVAPLIINPPAGSLTQGLLVTQTPTGSIGATNFLGSQFAFNTDNVAVSGVLNYTSVLNIAHNFGGAAMTGARESLHVQSTLTAAGNAVDSNRQYVSAVFSMNVGANNNNLGNYFGVGAVCGAAPSIGTFGQCAGIEADLFVQTGSTPAIKWGYSAFSITGDAVQGSAWDAGFAVLCQTGAVCWKNGFLVANQGGLGGVATTGTLFGTQGSFTVANALDASSATVTGNWLNFLGASAGITGSWQASTGTLTATSSVSSSPGFSLTNTTSDANGPGLSFQKSRTGGNTLAADSLGGIAAFGFANAASRLTADIAFSQAAASSGSNIPSNISFLTSNATTLFANSMKFDFNGHLAFTGPAPTANACAGFALGTGSSDTAGSLTYTSGTTCSITFGATYGVAPKCTVAPGTAASTVLAVPSTSGLAITFGTAQAALSWTCFGA
jgi:hypothetical protein